MDASVSTLNIRNLARAFSHSNATPALSMDISAHRFTPDTGHSRSVHFPARDLRLFCTDFVFRV